MIKKFFQPETHGTFGSLALLALRLTVGVAFMFHGWGKIQHPMDWMGPDATIPGFFQLLAAISEFGGGLAWALGLVTRLACLGIGSTMIVALHTHVIQRGDPFVSNTGGPAFELALVYFCVTLVLLSLGPGAFSLDRLIFGLGAAKEKPHASA